MKKTSILICLNCIKNCNSICPEVRLQFFSRVCRISRSGCRLCYVQSRDFSRLLATKSPSATTQWLLKKTLVLHRHFIVQLAFIARCLMLIILLAHTSAISARRSCTAFVASFMTPTTLPTITAVIPVTRSILGST